MSVADADKPLRIVVASHNPVKLRATEGGFRSAFPSRAMRFETVSVPSGVSDQPMTDEETLLGALNRAQAAAQQIPEADFTVGLEGGIFEEDGDQGEGGMHAFAWVVVHSAGREGRSRTATFELPEAVVRGVRAGKELGLVNDEVFGREGSKHEEGAVGILTGGALGRAGLYEPSVLLALIPFLQTP